MDPKRELLRRIRRVRHRWNQFTWFRGLAWVLGVGMVSLLASMGLAESTQIPAWFIVAMRFVLLGAVVGTAVKMLVLPLRRRPDDTALARFVEEKNPGLEDSLVSAVEFIHKPQVDSGPFGILLIRDALERTRRIRFEDLVDRQKFNMFAALSVCFALLLILSVYFSGIFFPYGSARLFAGLIEPPPGPDYSIQITPGDTTVPRGSDVVLEAVALGFDPERAEVHLRYDNSSQWETSTMDVAPEIVPTFRRLLFNVQEPIRYYVQAAGIQSAEFVISVADLPRVESVDYTYNFPGYTRLSSRTEVDALDIIALRGTQVGVTVHATQELQGGRLIFADGAEVALVPGDGQVATAELTVDRTTTFRIELENTRGQEYLGLSEYAMEALDDQKPLVQFTEPGRDYQASTVEEIFTELEAEDDLGIETLELVFSVNGGEEEKIDLFANGGTAPKEISGSYTFFLEEYEIEPGDFITYYGRAVDSARPTNSVLTDIYFIEVRPFGMEYFQGQQGGGGGGGDDSASALSNRQKEIIAATFRLIRDKDVYGPGEYSDNIQAVAESQSTLAEQTQTLMTRLNRRGLSVDEQIAQLTENLRLALEQMGPAAQHLSSEDLEGAQPFEQKSLQYLMRAEALFNQVQVTQGGGGGGGGGGQAAEDLADLFDLELDQNTNQYETLQRGEGAQSGNQELDEALQKLKELAERQQRMLEQQRQQALSGGTGGGSEQMTADEIRRETERLARQLDRLSRERNDPQMAEVGRALDQAARNMRQAQSGTSQQQQQASEQAIDELDRAQRLLAGAQGGSLEERLANLERQVRELADQQRGIADQAERLAADQNDAERRTAQITEEKNEAAEELESLQDGLEAVQGSPGANQETSRRVRSAANAIRSNRLADKMTNGQELLDAGYLEFAAQREAEIAEAIEDLERELSQAVASAANTEERQVQNALNQTSETIRRLESMQRRLEDQQGQQQGREPGQEPGQQPGQQSQQGQPGQQGQAGQQGESPQAGQQGQTGQQGQQGGRMGGQQFGGPEGGIGSPRGGIGRTPTSEDIRQLTREWEQRLQDVEDIRSLLGPNDPLSGDLGQITDAIRRRMEEHRPGNPVEIDALVSEIILPFRTIELELSRELQLLIGRENIRSAQEDEIPANYRRLVEEYYERLGSEND